MNTRVYVGIIRALPGGYVDTLARTSAGSREEALGQIVRHLKPGEQVIGIVPQQEN